MPGNDGSWNYHVCIPSICCSKCKHHNGKSYQLNVLKYVGAAIFVWAIIQFVLATKRSDADSKADAVQTAVCGIALMSIALIVNALGIGDAIDGSGTDFTDDKLK